MATTTYERGGGTRRITDAGDRLRTAKQYSPRGIGIFYAMIALWFVWMAISFWTASHIAPEPEESEGWLHQERERPASGLDDPRTIGQ